jgi:hypothetical protein
MPIIRSTVSRRRIDYKHHKAWDRPFAHGDVSGLDQTGASSKHITVRLSHRYLCLEKLVKEIGAKKQPYEIESGINHCELVVVKVICSCSGGRRQCTCGCGR